MYERVNSDGSVTLMPGEYEYRKNRAVISETISHNDNLREQKKKDSLRSIEEGSHMVSGFLKHKAQGGGASIEKYLGKERINQLKGMRGTNKHV